MNVTYNCDILLPNDHPDLKKFMEQCYQVALATWKENANTVLEMINARSNTRCFGKGDDKRNAKTFQIYDGYDGMTYITASRKLADGAPQMINPDGTALQKIDAQGNPNPEYPRLYGEMSRRLYGGCRVNIALKPWPQKAAPHNKNTNGIRCDLMAIQFAGDDKPFGEKKELDVSGGFSAVQGIEPIAASPSAQMPAAPFQQAPSLPSFFGVAG